MRFTPRYMVSYKGMYYPAGKPFEIDSADAEEMREHGDLEWDSEPVYEPVVQDVQISKEKPNKRPGRPRKNA